jgi:hypothetical protein
MAAVRFCHRGSRGGPSATQGVQLAATTAHTYCRHITVTETGGHWGPHFKLALTPLNADTVVNYIHSLIATSRSDLPHLKKPVKTSNKLSHAMLDINVEA